MRIAGLIIGLLLAHLPGCGDDDLVRDGGDSLDHSMAPTDDLAGDDALQPDLLPEDPFPPDMAPIDAPGEDLLRFDAPSPDSTPIDGPQRDIPAPQDAPRTDSTPIDGPQRDISAPLDAPSPDSTPIDGPQRDIPAPRDVLPQDIPPLDAFQADLPHDQGHEADLEPMATGETCDQAIWITDDGAYSANTTAMTDDHNSRCGSGGGRDVVFAVDLTEATDLHLSTEGSSFDTVLSLYRGECADHQDIWCDDDDGEGNRSVLSLHDLPPATYFIVVDGYDGEDHGHVVLTVDRTLRCNGRPDLCDRPFSAVSYPTTHNAMSSRDDNWVFPNQEHDVPQQLSDGVRGLMLDVHYWREDTYLCHEVCLGGNQPLVEGLGEIASFLAQNPNEVVTIILECYINAPDMEGAFVDSGLLAHAHEQAAGEPWPTLEEMIRSDRRLVVMTDDQGGAYPWYLAVWDFCFQTHWAAETPEDLTCTISHGDPGNDLFTLNHFLTAPLASPSLAEQVNTNPYFMDRAQECMAANNHLPNFPTVDFYDIGDLLDVVDALNGP